MKSSQIKNKSAKNGIIALVCVFGFLLCLAFWVNYQEQVTVERERAAWLAKRPTVVAAMKESLEKKEYNVVVRLANEHAKHSDIEINQLRDIAVNTITAKSKTLDDPHTEPPTQKSSVLERNTLASFDDGQRDGFLVGLSDGRSGRARRGNWAYDNGLRLTGSKTYANGYRYGYNEGWHKGRK